MSHLISPSPPPTRSIRSADSFITKPPLAVPATDSRKPGLTLAQRLLSPNPLTPLPPLFPTSTPDLVELSDVTYHFIALALRAFVLPWWSKITPRDKEFLPQITVVLQYVLRELVERCSEADFVDLILVKIPVIVQQHYIDFREASKKVGTSFAEGGADVAHIFQRIQPHVAIRSPDDGALVPADMLDATYLDALVDRLLKELLPKGDWECEAERNVIRGVIVGPVLGRVLPLLAEPWFLHQALLNLLKQKPNRAASTPPVKTSRFTFHSLVVLFLTAVQTVSTILLQLTQFSQSLVHLANTVNVNDKRSASTTPDTIQTRTAALYDLFFVEPSDAPGFSLVGPTVGLAKEMVNLKQEPLAHPALGAALASAEMGSEALRTFVNKFLPYTLKTFVLNAKTIKIVLEAGTQVLFPEANNGYPLPSPPTPSLEEQALNEQELVKQLSALIPGHILSEQVVREMLGPLSSAPCNMNLVVRLVDAIVCTLFPSML